MKKNHPKKTAGYDELPQGALSLNSFIYGKSQWKAVGNNKKYTYPYIQIIQVQMGHHEVHCLGQSAVIKPGNIYIIPTHIPFNLIPHSDPKQGITKTRWMLLHATIFKATDFTHLFVLPLTLGHDATAKINSVFNAIDDKNSYDSQSHALWKDARMSELGFAALCGLCDIGTLKPNWRASLNNTDRLKHVLIYIHENLGVKITPAKLAAKMNLSLSQFHTVFREKMGKTSSEYINQIRLDEASRQLMTSDESLRLVAEKTGFYDEFHFSRAFKKYFKVTPSAFRQKHRPAKK